jgi:hypothetical protein
MELAAVERALKRPDEYFLEDGLWEITWGLWMALTVALPLFVGGAAANWSSVLMLLTGLVLRPAVLAAKRRWVYPRTGCVTYPELPVALGPVSLGLSPATAPAGEGVPRSRIRVLLIGLIGMGAAVLMALALQSSRRFGYGNAGGHLAVGVALGGFLLFAAFRWRQRRWIALAGVVMVVSALVAFSGLPGERALAWHAAALAGAFVASGALAFAAYRRRTAALPTDGATDGR